MSGGPLCPARPARTAIVTVDPDQAKAGIFAAEAGPIAHRLVPSAASVRRRRDPRPVPTLSPGRQIQVFAFEHDNYDKGAIEPCGSEQADRSHPRRDP